VRTSSSIDLVAAISIFRGVLGVAILAYGAYWAFSIRKALAVPTYKRQALWVGAYCVIFMVTYLFTSSGGSCNCGYALLYYINPTLYVAGNTGALGILVSIFYTVFLLLFFPWIDSNIAVGRRSDPLLRNTFHWKTLRLVLWGIVLATFAIGWIGVAIFAYTGFASAGNLAGIANQLTNFGFSFMALAAIVPGIPVLLITARRSKDPTFRRSLKWFGVFLLFLAIEVSGSSLIPTPNYAAITMVDVIGVFFSALIGYLLYKSAMALVPLNRIALDFGTLPSTNLDFKNAPKSGGDFFSKRG
jgi:hypothetical protein